MTIHPPIPASDGMPDSAPPPDGRPLLTVGSYDDAVAAVDALAEEGFPVRHTAIVGRGARSVESVTGRYGLGRAVASGAASGAAIGLFFGLLFDWWGALTPEDAWGWLAFEGLVYGALVGCLVALLFHRAGSGREFSSFRTLEADQFEVVLTGGERAEALRILHQARHR